MNTKKQYGWTSDDMGMALATCRNVHLGVNECCRQYNVPSPSLKRHLQSSTVIANKETTVLTPRIEAKLVQLIINL